MRKLFVLLLIIASLPPVVCAGFPRHMDPLQLTLRNPEPAALFELYGYVYGSIRSGNYTQAKELLALFRDITSPSATDKVLRDYNGVLGEVIDDLSETKSLLRVGYEYLKWFRDSHAEEALRQAEPYLVEANESSIDLELGSQGLASLLSGSPDKLLSGVDDLKEAVAELELELRVGLLEAERIRLLRLEGMQVTFLEIEADNLQPYVGDSITLSGFLFTADGAGVPHRNVTITLEGGAVDHVATGSEGVFTYKLELPLRYEPSLRVHAEFMPSSEDACCYLPSASETVTLRPIYYTPTILVSGPTVVYPGQSFTVSGGVMYLQEPMEGITLSLQYFDVSHRAISGEDGGFSFTLSTPRDAPEGTRRIVVGSSAQGLYGPSSEAINVEVTRIPVELSVESPWVVFSGGQAVITGEVRVSGAALPGCLVQVEVANRTLLTATDESGSFTSGFIYSWSTLSSRYSYRVVAMPNDPWMSTDTYRNGFFLVNPLPPLGLLVLLGALVAARRAPKPIPQLPEVTPTLAPPEAPEPTGFPGVYLRAVKAITKFTGVHLAPSNTLREYLHRVKPVLHDAAYRLFDKISGTYEMWVYGGTKSKPPTRSMDAMLEKLRDELEQG